MLRISLVSLRRTATAAAVEVTEPKKKKKRIVKKVKKIKKLKRQPIEEWDENLSGTAQVDVDFEEEFNQPAHTIEQNVDEKYAPSRPVDPDDIGALFPTIDPQYPSYPTQLAVNHLDETKREKLHSLFAVAGITDGNWNDFGLVNHLSTTKWVMETHRFNTLGLTIAKLALSKTIFEYTITKGISWERHYPPVTFEVNKSDLIVGSPNEHGNKGFPRYDPAVDHLPDVSSDLSYLHIQQLEAVHLNEGNLSLLGSDWGLEGLMHSDELPTIQDFTPAERLNPTLIIKPTELMSSDPNLENTNLGPINRTLGNEVGQKVLALIGSVKVEKNRARATKVANHIFQLQQGDLVDNTINSLDRQVMELDPTSVMTNILSHLDIEVEYRTEVIETPLSPQEIANIEMSLEDAKQISDSAAIEREVLMKKGTEIRAIEERLEKAKWEKPKRHDEDQETGVDSNVEKETNPQEGDGQIDVEAAAKIDTSSASDIVPEVPTDREIVHDDDEYTLQFDAKGDPIDIRQTSLKYPIEPGPHQADYPISDAPMYSPPKPDATFVERIHWKTIQKQEKDLAKRQLESMFTSVMAPKNVSYKCVMLNKKTEQILGYGESTCSATARVKANMEALTKLRSNLLSLKTPVSHEANAEPVRDYHDVESTEVKASSA